MVMAVSAYAYSKLTKFPNSCVRAPWECGKFVGVCMFPYCCNILHTSSIAREMGVFGGSGLYR